MRGAVFYFLILTCFFDLKSQNYSFRFDWGVKGFGTSQMMNPQSVASGKGGDIYVMDMVNEKVKKFDSLGVYKSSFSVPRSSYDLVVDFDGNIIVSGTDGLVKYSPSGSVLLTYSTGWFGDVTIDSNGDIIALISVVGDKYVVKYNNNGGLSAYWAYNPISGSEISFPSTITVDSDDNVYIFGYPNTLYKYDAQGFKIGSWELGEQITRIIAAKNGDILGCTKNDDINVYSNEGVFKYTFGKPGIGDAEFDTPIDVAVGGSGFIWILDRYNNRIQGMEYCSLTPAKPGEIKGDATPCESTKGNTYSISSVIDAIGYNWDVPEGWTIVSGQGTTEIVVDINEGASSDSITVAAFNSCGEGRKRGLSISLKSTPEISMYDKYICTGQKAFFAGHTGYSSYYMEGPNNQTWNSREVEVTEFGKYKFTITGGNGCVNSDSAEVVEKNVDCENTDQYPWTWPGHRNWFIGRNQYFAQIIDMQTNLITPVGVSGVTKVHNYEGSTCVSNDEGELMFYATGKHLFAETGSGTKMIYEELRPNNYGATQHATSAVQGIITIRHPETPKEYYVLITDEDVAGTIGLNYTKFNELGENLAPYGPNRIGDYKTTEGIAATTHANGKDIWIVTKNANNTDFYSYLLTEDGLDTVPVVSSVGAGPGWGSYGALAFSYDGTKFSCVGSTKLALENIGLFDFDKSTGEIYNPKFIGDELNYSITPYDVIFSPNGDGLLASMRKSGVPDELVYYDISDWSNTNSIRNSKLTFDINGTALEYGSDGFLYTMISENNSIDNRILARIKGDYNNGIGLTSEEISGTQGSWGLPTMYLPPSSALNSNEERSFKGLKVYPNPVTDILNIEIEGLSFEWTITNLSGSIIANGKFQNQMTFNSNTLAPGVYFVSIQNSYGQVVKKIIKK